MSSIDSNPQGQHGFGGGNQESDFSVSPASACRQCAQKGRTCCQDHDIYVTLGDCERIALATGHKDFFEFRGCSDLDYVDQEDDPVWRIYVFRPDGTRRVLRRKENKDCRFLGSSGCELPLTVRPLVCRLFPHLYTFHGLYFQWDEACPAVWKVSENKCGSAIEGIALDEAVTWHRLLYEEVRREVRTPDGAAADQAVCSV